MTKVKICGLRREEDVRYVNRYLPDFAGFVFAKSKRKVTKETAKQLREQMDDRILAVGVFVNASLEEIRELCEEGIIQMIQLHGDENRGYMEALRDLLPGVPVIRAVRVRNRRQVEEAEALPCDYLLLDSWSEGQYGGSGKQFDKDLVPALSKPFFLAGGLTADNVAENIRRCRPWAVDVSSAVETEGWKDEAKIREFLEHSRNL